ncbi:NUDIX hydrolase [Amorphus coralli]|uniref:NUDIX hydrolase n=1 Tax=Amorphus coralli TaxID=340680 RepID=UPI00058FCD1F|nr:NUDIX hydrolase [Amorphus coralli]
MAPSALPRLGVSVACWRGDRVLLVERGKDPLRGLWSLPGGSVEPGEPVRAAALRELQEETGISAEIGGIVEVLDVIRRDESGHPTVHFAIAVFAARHLAGEAVAADDAADARWCLPDEIDTLPTTDGLADIVDRSRGMLG